MKYVLIFGREPELSLAEAEALFDIESSGPNACVIESDLEPGVIIDTLGGTIKIGTILAQDGTGLGRYLVSNNVVQNPNAVFGVSDYAGYFKNEKEYLLLHKKIKQRMGKKSRYVLNYPALSTVQVAKHGIISSGFEYLIFGSGGIEYLGQTSAIQNFEEYSARDYEKPCRPKGALMMPPKLAKILINLTVRRVNLHLGGVDPFVVYDPFVGSGTIPTEALLLNFKALASDIADESVSCARKNIAFVVERYKITNIRNPEEVVFKSDAREVPLKDGSVDFIVTEGALGPAWTKAPEEFLISRSFGELEKIWAEALTEFKRILKPGGRIGFILPEISGRSPDILDHVNKLGYNLLVKKPLIYKREGQIVGRKIWLIQKPPVRQS